MTVNSQSTEVVDIFKGTHTEDGNWSENVENVPYISICRLLTVSMNIMQ